MHQTFYIDVDEEMSSVIDRLNKSMSMDNYFVVPKRALFLQSIVNLKILKREADKMSKRVIVVTQDETVISMAERCGIEIRESLDGVEAVSDAYLESTLDDQEQPYEDEEEMEEEFENKLQAENDKSKRLKNIGSGEFFQAGVVGAAYKSVAIKRADKVTAAKAVNLPAKIAKRIRPEKIVLQKVPKQTPHKEPVRVNGISHAKTAVKATTPKTPFKGELDPHKAQTIEKLFSGYENHPSISMKPDQHIGNGKMKNFFALFIVLCVLVFAGVGAYLFFPSAKIIIKSDINKKKIDTEIVATIDSASNDKSIPLKVIESEDQIAFSYDIKGASATAGKKAKGTVVVYNGYSSEPQTLIATTRLEAENGKIFRLVKNVVVPGSTTVGGQTKPGAIQAEIVADQAGSDYNMDSVKFTIPGFAGGPKFDKFYATSDSAITGGSSEGQVETSLGKVTQADFDAAKQKAEAAFKEKIMQSAKDKLSDGEILLEQAQKISISKSSSSAKVGTATDSIEWTVGGSIKSLVFNENDVKKVVLDSITENNDKTGKIKNEISKIDYGSVEPDFDKPSLKIRVYCEVNSVPVLDTEQIKKELLGKNDSQLADILRKYTTIKSANVEFSPSFITKIPSYSSRVTIEVLNEAK